MTVMASVQSLAMQLSKASVRSKHCGTLPLFLTIAQMAQTRTLGLWEWCETEFLIVSL